MKNRKYFFIVFSALSFISALMFYYDARKLLSDSADAAAVIVGKNENSKHSPDSNSGNYTYAIEFITEDGRKISTSIRLSSDKTFNPGERISIIYSKENPASVSVRYPLKVFYFSKAIMFFCLSLVFDIAAYKIRQKNIY